MIKQAEGAGPDRSQASGWSLFRGLLWGLLLVWVVGTYRADRTYGMSEPRFLAATHTGYFKTLSTYDGDARLNGMPLTGLAAADDCRLLEPDTEERQRLGVRMFGVCRLDTTMGTVSYELALGGWATFVWSDDNIDELLSDRQAISDWQTLLPAP